MTRIKRQQSGFTLVELMVVMIIIGILIAVAMPQFAAAQDRARIASLKSNAHVLQVMAETFYVDNQRYPALITDFTELDAYKVLQNPFTGFQGVADAAGQGAWRTNNDGDAAAADSDLGSSYADRALSQGLVIYVGLDSTGNATTRFLGNGQQGSEPTMSYLIYVCDRSGLPVKGMLLNVGPMPSTAAANLQRGHSS
ncbi:MAG: type II secretion system protein [Candidatus Sericytochromatia bacterium]|jgi:prepilin-type N-terminal cleavage/methylation domain-containing protein|nr:type II secretion system protein [Candidatus Sericytochromatia bacterium]